MPAPKKRINIELHLSLSATFLSLAALVVSIFQTKIAREQQQKSVLPYLQVRHQIQDNSVHIMLENKGVGPAFIRQILIGHGKNESTDYVNFISKELGAGELRFNELSNRPKITDEAMMKEIKKDSLLTVWYDWWAASKAEDVVESGTAIKEGDLMTIYQWRKKGNVSGPFLDKLQDLMADSTYQIKIFYSDVYDNCWQLTHVHNKNNVTELANCPEP
ncbi:hypothetical protein IC229_07875 [Spirosoma sp. BT702]|uniref:Uncharacterized protein n=1 Tax=Spirosoma profusum TaxID=2771354 RepID=A0A926XZ54_9BACT|nr:hypothetical protein [Spirosoma profusum]MBD2700548.1 hypothetical protein [Spirosoma profusum]